MNMWDSVSRSKWLIVAPFICLYLWNERTSLLTAAKIEGLSINFWDSTLQGVSDVYLIIYLLFPLYLF